VALTRRSIEAARNDVFGVLARSIPARLIEISRSGCLLESGRHVEEGTISELQLQTGGVELLDDVRVTRCVRVEGSGSSYLVGAEFVQTRRPGERSIRRAVTGLLRSVTLREGTLTPKKLSRSKGQAEAVGAAPVVNSVSTGEAVMKDLFARLVREDEGQDLIEYGLLAGLITTALVGFIGGIGVKVLGYFTNLNAALPVPPSS
jgi:Flp pilus assembly pilin Flp